MSHHGSAAQLDLIPLDSGWPDPVADATTLRAQAAAQLAAHRARRRRAEPELPGLAPAQHRHPENRAARIAATVAERYAHSQSYRAFLAAEARRAIEQADAAAEVAARTAEAVAAAQQRLLSELDAVFELEAVPELVASAPAQPSACEAQPARVTVRLYEEVGLQASNGTANAVLDEALDDEQRLALDDEIAFRQAPVFDRLPEPAVALPANVIQFPRQLVAPRKARPRLAEGPLCQDAILAADPSQLRIFEVERDQIATQVLPEPEPALPEWSSIRLSACAPGEPLPATFAPAPTAPAILTAPLRLRLMSAVVDGCVILAAFLGFITVAARVAGVLPAGPLALVASGVSLGALATLYFLLFFTFSNATPGMLYARIGLCTFADDNPTRSAMRRRLAAMLLATCPLGLGLLWAWLDEEGLGWHDRLSRMYQRAY